MSRSRFVILFICLFALSVALPSARGERSAAVNAEIEYLLQRVYASDAKFIRSGKEYTPAEAVAHLRKKLSAAGDRVNTTEDFIEGIASKSYLSGKPYYLLKDGKQIPTEAWLKQALVEKRDSK